MKLNRYNVAVAAAVALNSLPHQVRCTAYVNRHREYRKRHWGRQLPWCLTAKYSKRSDVLRVRRLHARARIRVYILCERAKGHSANTAQGHQHTYYDGVLDIATIL